MRFFWKRKKSKTNGFTSLALVEKKRKKKMLTLAEYISSSKECEEKQKRKEYLGGFS